MLGIHKDDTGREVLSVSAQNVPEEYLVFYTVRYSVKAGAEELVAPQTVTLTRGYSWEETEVLAKAREEDVLRQALAKDLVSIVMHRLESL